MKIEVAVKEYLVEIEVRKFTKKTIRSYRNNLNLFLRYCQEEADVFDMEDLTLAVIRKFTLYMTGKGRKGSYINGLLKVAKAFIQYCYEEGYGGFNTKKNFKWCKQEKAVIMAFTPADVRTILKSCKGGDFLQIRDAAILTMLFETGVRCWELCCIRPSDVHGDYIIINGKNHKQRVVPVTPILRKAMMKYELAAENYFTLKNTDDTTIDLSFTKVWAGDSDFKARPAKLTFKVYNKKDTEFKNPVQSIEVNTTNDTRKVYTFTGLPKYNDDSTLAEYVIRENAVSKYTTSYSADGLTVTNTRKYGKILLVKDNEGSKIAGTQFGIYSNSTCTNLVSTITTDGQGVARSGKLEYGTYYVKETKAIDGYTIKRTVYKATINSNGICYITKANNTSTKSFNENLTGVVAIENKQNRLEISKVDASDEHTLEGAVLALYNSSGEEIERWTTTNEKKVFKGLSYGNYTIKELKAPKGYNTAEDIKVTITEDTETLSVKMYDDKGIEMPETGGAGRTGVYVISLILLLAGTLYLVPTKKAEKE